MYQLGLAFESEDVDRFAEACNVVSEASAVKFLTSLFLQELEPSPEQFRILMEKVQSQSEEISSLQMRTLCWALKNKSPFLQSLISHPNFNPTADISNYIRDCPLELFPILLASDKVFTNPETLERLLEINHPKKIEIYMNSERFIVPSAYVVAKLARLYFGNHYSFETVLLHPKINGSKIDKKQLDYWKENWPEMIEILNNKPKSSY